jgi:hypothetical protein
MISKISSRRFHPVDYAAIFCGTSAEIIDPFIKVNFPSRQLVFFWHHFGSEGETG